MHILENIELRKTTTLRLGGTVPFFYDIRHEAELYELTEMEEKKGSPIYLLGGGSNLLIADQSMGHKNDMLPFSVAQIQISYENEDTFHDTFLWQDDSLAPPLAKKYLAQNLTEKTLRAEVGAGMALQKFLKLCAEKGCTGLEGLVGVPGKVGGAIAMNAGAYLCDMDSVLESVRIFHKDYGILTLYRHDFANSYRSFNAFLPKEGEKNRQATDMQTINRGVIESGNEREKLTDFIICGASFVFPVIERENVKKNMQEHLSAKKSTQPIKAFTAGCVFKNPAPIHTTNISPNIVTNTHTHDTNTCEKCTTQANLSAGKLLDEVGMKGKEVGGMRFSPIHANFLENTGNGNTQSAIALIEEAIERVYTHTHIKLEKEVKVWL